MKEGEVLIGKLTPPKFLSEAKDLSIQSKKEASTVVRQEERVLLTDLGKLKKDSEFIIKHLRKLNRELKNERKGEIVGKREVEEIERKIGDLFAVTRQGMKEAYLIVMRDCLFKFLMLEDVKKLERMDEKFAVARLIPRKFVEDLGEKIHKMIEKIRGMEQQELEELRRELTKEAMVKRKF